MSGADTVRDGAQARGSVAQGLALALDSGKTNAHGGQRGGPLQPSTEREGRARLDLLADRPLPPQLLASAEGGREREQSTRDGPWRRRARWSSGRNSGDVGRRGETRVPKQRDESGLRGNMIKFTFFT
jgi:hypothetical protein